jgi:hypothetical protein
MRWWADGLSLFFKARSLQKAKPRFGKLQPTQNSLSVIAEQGQWLSLQAIKTHFQND